MINNSVDTQLHIVAASRTASNDQKCLQTYIKRAPSVIFQLFFCYGLLMSASTAIWSQKLFCGHPDHWDIWFPHRSDRLSSWVLTEDPEWTRQNERLHHCQKWKFWFSRSEVWMWTKNFCHQISREKPLSPYNAVWICGQNTLQY